MFFLQVLDTDSFLPPAFPHVGSSENENKWKQWTLALHCSWSGFSTQNSGCSSSSWRLIVWFWGSAWEAMQGLSLTVCHVERGRQSVAQMSHTTATTWEKGKHYPCCIAETPTSVMMKHQRKVTLPRFHYACTHVFQFPFTKLHRNSLYNNELHVPGTIPWNGGQLAQLPLSIGLHFVMQNLDVE